MGIHAGHRVARAGDLTLYGVMKVALVFLALVGCGGSKADTIARPAAAPVKQAPEPKTEAEPGLAIPKEPAPAPDELIATIGVASPSALLAEAGTFADAVVPGTGAAVRGMPLAVITSELMGVTLGGVDDGKPMWVLIMDPSETASSSPVVVVAAVEDRAAFDAAAGSQDMVTAHDGGFGAIGSREAMAIAAPYALSSLARKPAPAKPTVTVFVARSMERFGPQIRAGIAVVEQQLADTGSPEAATGIEMVKGFLKLVEQLEVATVSLDLSGAASLFINVIPKQGSGAARVFARQPAASLDGLGRYGGADVLIAAHLDWASLGDVFSSLTEAGYRGYSGEAQAAMREFYAATFGLIHGEATMGLSFDKGLSLTGEWGVSDPKEAERRLRGALRKLGALKSKVGPLYRITARPTAFRHRRVRVGSMTMTPAKDAPPEQREMMEKLWGKGAMTSFLSVAGTSYLMTMGASAKRAMRAAIDRARAEPAKAAPLPARFTKAVATARARKESCLGLIDLAAVAAAVDEKARPPSGSEPFAMGLGFSGGRLSLRLTLPVDQARQLASQSAP